MGKYRITQEKLRPYVWRRHKPHLSGKFVVQRLSRRQKKGNMDYIQRWSGRLEFCIGKTSVTADLICPKFAELSWLTMPGVPGIYFHSLFGSRNYPEGVETSGIKRRINREKFDFDSFMSEMEKSGSHRKKVYERYKKLLKLRKKLPQLNPYSDFSFPFISDTVFAIRRKNLLALFNFSGKTQKTEIKDIQTDLLTGQKYKNNLLPWQCVWLVRWIFLISTKKKRIFFKIRFKKIIRHRATLPQSNVQYHRRWGP